MDRNQDIPFVFEGGVLRPEGHVDLPEGARGIARISQPTWTPAIGQRAMNEIRELAKKGVLRAGARKITRDEMHERD